jgi:hypothetical protein
MMSAGNVEGSKVISNLLCGPVYSGGVEGGVLPICERKAADQYRKIVGAAEMDDVQKGVVDASLANAASKAAGACIAETRYAWDDANARQRRQLTACTSKYIAGGRLFAFDGKRGLTYEKLLRHLVGRAQGRVALAAEEVEIPFTLRRGMASARPIEEGLFSVQALHLFRGAMAHIGGERRAAAAEEVALRVMEQLQGVLKSYRAEKDPLRRAAIAEAFLRTFVAKVEDDGAAMTCGELPYALSEPDRLGIRGHVTPQLRYELRRLFTEALVLEQKRPGGPERFSHEAIAEAVIEQVRAMTKKDPTALANALRQLRVTGIGMKLASSYGGDDGVMTVTFGKRRGGQVERIADEEQPNPTVISKKKGAPASQPRTGGCIPNPITGKRTCDDDVPRGDEHGEMDDVTKESATKQPDGKTDRPNAYAE